MTHEVTAEDVFGPDDQYPPMPSPQDVADALADRALDRPPPAADVNLNVPFIHQLWDTPDDFDGHWAFGAVSSTMVLAYYGLLKPRPIEVTRPQKHRSLFGWYLSNPFSHGGHTFSATAGSPPGRMVPGIYGTVLDNHSPVGWCTAPSDSRRRGRGIATLMSHFLPKDGPAYEIAYDLRQKPQGTVEQLFRKTLDGGHPLIVSGSVFGWGHVIVLRGYARDKRSGVTRWIVNDPFGFKTRGLPGGGNVVYEYNEIRPKWAVLFSGGDPG